MDPIKIEDTSCILNNFQTRMEIKQETTEFDNNLIDIVKHEDPNNETKPGFHTNSGNVKTQVQSNNYEEYKPEIKRDLHLTSKKIVKKNKVKAEQAKKYPRKCDHCNYEVPKRGDHYRHYMYMHTDIIHKYPYTPRKKVACSYCGVLKAENHIRDHELNHGERKLSCKLCTKMFHNNKQLKRHVDNVHAENKLICNYCSKGFKQRIDIVRHIRIHTGEKPFKCNICGAGFAHSGNRIAHLRSNHHILNYIPKPTQQDTEKSNGSDKDASKVRKENSIKKEIKPDVVKKEDESIQETTSLNVQGHINNVHCKICLNIIHSEVKETILRGICDYCYKTSTPKINLFSDITDKVPSQSTDVTSLKSNAQTVKQEPYEIDAGYKSHTIWIDTPNSTITSTSQKRRNTNKRELSEINGNHKLNVCQNNNTRKPTVSSMNRKRRKVIKLECNESDEDCKPKKTSESHDLLDQNRVKGKKRKVPKQEYPRQCEHCNYEVPKRGEHYRHYLFMHTDILHKYPYKPRKRVACSFCGVMKAQNHIKQHELKHGEKNVKCSRCPKIFYNNSCLKKHFDAVHTDKRFTCNYCSKTFKTREVIVRHIRVHTGEKPYKCQYCGSGFAHSGNRAVHIRSAHQHLKEETCTKRKSSKQ